MASLFERCIGLSGEDEHLVVRLGVRRPACRQQHVVGLRAVGDRPRHLLDCDLSRGRSGNHGCDAAAEVADADLGRGGGDQQLVLAQLAEICLQRGRAAEVAHDRPDLDLVHGVHHARGGA